MTARIRPGDPVVVDFGAVFDGYRSDMTRTFCVGGEPSGELATVFEVVAESQRAGVRVGGARGHRRRGRPGLPGGHRRVRVGGARSSTAPGTGWASTSTRRRRSARGRLLSSLPGTVVTVEPGVYLPGTGGVRIEDTLVVTDGRQPPAHPVPEGSCRLMAVSTNDLRNGMTLDLPEGLFAVVEFQHVKPGKGGAFVRTKLKNLRTGAVIERTYRADEKLEQAIIDKREMQFLYRDGSDYVFMDTVVLRAAPGGHRPSWATPPIT